MSFDPLIPKRNSFFKPVINLIKIKDFLLLKPTNKNTERQADDVTFKTPKIKNVTFTERALSLHDLTHFYGTDTNGERDKYGITITRAVNKRIMSPLTDYYENAFAYFFKPYGSSCNLIFGAFSPINTAMFTFGVLGTLGIFANPYVVVAMICAPAVVELIAGMMSLSQAIYHKTKAMLTNDQAEHDKASEHFLDATTRFALVLPLAMICIVTFPLEVVRFFTRTIMSIAQLINDLKSAFTNASTSSKNFDPIPFEALENDDNEYDEEDTLGRVFTK